MSTVVPQSPAAIPAEETSEHLGWKLFLLATLLYLFIVSVQLLGSSFKLFGAGLAETIFNTTADPIVGLFVGVLATSLIQSSSTTTSIIVGLVASGVISFESAVPMVMGANIGTTITNTIVSLGHLSRSDEFERAFAGSVVHDFFNICAVLVLFPLQAKFNLIGRGATSMAEVFEGFGGLKFASPFALMTKPVAKWIIAVLDGNPYLCAGAAIALMFVALRYIVKVLKSMVLSRVERFFQRYIFRTPVLGFLLGIMLTIAVQSSSITSSLVVPLIGAGVISLDQIYSYLLGANIGTTVTAFLASFATGSADAVRVAFAHLLFNIYGTALFWPLKRIPITMARTLAHATRRSRIIPIVYILIVFFAIPGLIIYLKD
jgi:sodium-dependent phosphate cotransporter